MHQTLLKLSNFIPLFLLSFIYSQKVNASESYPNFTNDSIRIVTLTSLSTDIVSKISLDKLVAIPGSSIFRNNKEFNKLPRISFGRTPPNLEKIVSLKPNLVIGTKGFHDKILNKLDSIDIETISYELRNWNDLENLSSLISSKIGINYTNYTKPIINNSLNQCSLRDDNKEIPNVVVLASTKPILSPNSKSWAGNLLKRLGFNSLTKNLDSKSQYRGYVNLSPEWLLKNDPDSLIVIETNSGQYSDFGKTKPFSALSAVKSNKIYKFDYYGLINAGSLESINKACKKLKTIN